MKYLSSIKAKLEGSKKYAYVCWGSVCTSNGDAFGTLGGATDKVGDFYTGAVAFSAVVAVIYLLYGAYAFIMSAGDEQKAQTGMAAVTNSIIGLVIIFIANLVIRYLAQEVF